MRSPLNVSNTANSLLDQILEEDLESIREKAEAGDKIYQFALGNFYMYGVKVSKDTTQALDWYERAVESGSPDAAYNLGIHYLDRIPWKALYWFVKSSELGHKGASYNAAVMFAGAENEIEKDDELAEYYFLKSIEFGRLESHLNLGIFYLEEDRSVFNYHKAFEHLSNEAVANNADAQVHLAYLYLNGYGTEKDIQKAVTLIQKSAKQGNKRALAFIKEIYNE